MYNILNILTTKQMEETIKEWQNILDLNDYEINLKRSESVANGSHPLACVWFNKHDEPYYVLMKVSELDSDYVSRESDIKRNDEQVIIHELLHLKLNKINGIFKCKLHRARLERFINIISYALINLKYDKKNLKGRKLIRYWLKLLCLNNYELIFNSCDDSSAKLLWIIEFNRIVVNTSLSKVKDVNLLEAMIRILLSEIGPMFSSDDSRIIKPFAKSLSENMFKLMGESINRK